ncbi:MAG: hypothetical protein Q4F93_05985 [bacterium]|nr:hypothetical protein [bacterium]
MSTFLLIAGVLLLSAGVVLAFRSATSGVAFSYLGIMALYDSRYVAIDSNLVLFWALGVLIVLFANFWRRMRRPATNVCRNYIVGGTLVGMLVGMLLGYAGMVGGAVVGAALGAVAWSRTPSGHASAEPLLAVFARIGLPAVVTMSIAGIALDAVANA